MLLVVEDGFSVRVALALLLVDLLLVDALVPGGLAQLAGTVAHVLAVHLSQGLCALYWICEAHKAIACIANWQQIEGCCISTQRIGTLRGFMRPLKWKTALSRSCPKHGLTQSVCETQNTLDSVSVQTSWDSLLYAPKSMDRTLTFGFVGALVAHDLGLDKAGVLLEGLLQHFIIHLIAQVAHKYPAQPSHSLSICYLGNWPAHSSSDTCCIKHLHCCLSQASRLKVHPGWPGLTLAHTARLTEGC